MSADLLAAFGVPESSDNSDQSTRVAVSTTAPVSSRQSAQNPWILQSRPLPPSVSKEPEKPLWKQDRKGTDVLFDASDDEQDEDDFGDFETAATSTAIQESPAVDQVQPLGTDLLGLDDFPDMQISTPQQPAYAVTSKPMTTTDLLGLEKGAQNEVLPNQTPRPELQDTWQPEPPNIAIEDDDWGDFENIEPEPIEIVAPATLPNPSMSQLSQAITSALDEDDDWDTFEDESSTVPASSVATTQATPTTHDPPQTSLQTTSKSTPPLSQPRPTNIPPPSSLLQLLPQIYQALATQLRSLSLSPSSPADTSAQQVLLVYTVTAHLIAGRSLRWKRDTLLSQSTRISQAGLKNTGMKLTALDKSLTVKEDQDVMDAIAEWRRHAAVFNAAMLKAKIAKPQGNLSANMPVRTAAGPGVLVSKESCAVCGLRRNERVSGVDGHVEDTFGEWWVEFWGHRHCCEFWYAYEGMLSRR